MDKTEEDKYAVYQEEEEKSTPPQTRPKAKSALSPTGPVGNGQEVPCVVPTGEENMFLRGRAGKRLANGRGQKQDLVKPEVQLNIDPKELGSFRDTLLQTGNTIGKHMRQHDHLPQPGSEPMDSQLSVPSSLPGRPKSISSPFVLPNPLFKQTTGKVKVEVKECSKPESKKKAPEHAQETQKEPGPTSVLFQPPEMAVFKNSGPHNIKRTTLPDWSIKNVQINIHDQDEAFSKIRDYFAAVLDFDKFLELTFAYVHFNNYCPAPGQITAPAEFCCLTWNLKDGMVLSSGGSPIDPGSDKLGDWKMVQEQSRKLSLPIPPYTYSRGLAYSVGEDRYDEVVKSILEQSRTFELSDETPRRPYHYVFAAEDNIPIAVGCLAWLMAQHGSNPRMRVLSMERFVSELFRTCHIRQCAIDLQAKVVQEVQGPSKKSTGSVVKASDPVGTGVGGGKAKSTTTKDGPLPAEISNLAYVASIKYATATLHSFDISSSLDRRLRLGCLWHQRENTSDSIVHCSMKQCKKWMYKTLEKALEILKRNYSAHSKELAKRDIEPVLWEESDAMGVEARQRLGFFTHISQKRTEVLERGFIFPDLLKEMQLRMPNGLETPPTQLIWPLERCVELDLNWSRSQRFKIVDLEPEARGERLAELKRQIHPVFPNGAVDLMETNRGLEEQIKELNKKLDALEVGGGGSRISRNKKFDDSTCFNCESASHFTNECKLQCFIRNQDKTTHGKYEPVGRYSFQMRLPGRPAGEVVSFYEELLKVKLSREEVQLAFAFYFFDEGCWNCAHPFHHRPDCDKNLNKALHDIAKRMHEINHPLTDEARKKKLERKLLYQKPGRPN
ncbi:uncharacterized protein LOC110846608 isoform X1 [Folsomia candida]|uniref:uncharacterized protein LOC110846608 isoform X1 n=1 Tax=Folsomia candida TaxID=158441 RepID=UPI001604F3E4|nr:uncharacterized protein LOC110846608 isoform X1 [Folsomia candida]